MEAPALREKCETLWRYGPRGLYAFWNVGQAGGGPYNKRVVTVGNKFVPSVAHAIATNTTPVFPILQDVMDGLCPDVEPLIHAAFAVGLENNYDLEPDLEMERFKLVVHGGARFEFHVWERSNDIDEVLLAEFPHLFSNHPPRLRRDICNIQWVE